MLFSDLCPSILDAQVQVLSLEEFKNFDNKKLVWHCGECGKVISEKPVAWDKFEDAVDRANGSLDTYGEDDFSPEIKTNEIHYWRLLCGPCRREIDD